MAIDQKVIDLLKKTDFEKYKIGGSPLYVNMAQSSIQKLLLTFNFNYDNPRTARIQEQLIDLYIQGISKGTETHPSADALTRAFIGNRMPDCELVSQRNDTKLRLMLSLTLPAGKIAYEKLGYAMNLIQELFTIPKVLKDPEIFERSKQGVIRSIQGQMNDHKSRARSLFNNKYFTASEPCLDEELIEIVSKAILEECKEAFENQLRKALPVILFSGDMNAEKLGDEIFSFLGKTSGTGFGIERYQMLESPMQQRLSKVGSRVHIEGPSQQMQFRRAYPLNDLPELTEQIQLELANSILGGGWTGHLMQTIREKHHLVYGIGSFFASFGNAIILVTEHAPKDYSKMQQLTGEVVQNFIEGKFKEEEFNEVQNSLMEKCLISHGGGIVSCDHPQFRINNGLERFVTKTEVYSLAEKYKILSETTPEKIKAVVQKYLDPKKSQTFTYCQEKGQ